MEVECQENTKKKINARNIQLTLNEIEKWTDLRLYLQNFKNLNYIIACEEIAPSTGHHHIHCYCQFKKCTTLAISKLQGAHIELCRGSAQQNINYIKKDGNIIFEDGEPIKKGQKTIEEIKNMTKEERDQLPAQLYKIVEKINTNEDNKIHLDDIYKNIKVYWFWGKSGVGKTRRAIQMFKDNGYEDICMVKYTNEFWIGTNTEVKACLYDDFRDSHMKPSELINFIDYNIHPMNIKGGCIQNRYEFIIITSIQNPEEIYQNKSEEEKRQWLRRIKEIIHIDPIDE